MTLENDIKKALEKHANGQWLKFSAYVRLEDGGIEVRNQQLESITDPNLMDCHKYFDRKKQ